MELNPARSATSVMRNRGSLHNPFAFCTRTRATNSVNVIPVDSETGRDRTALVAITMLSNAGGEKLTGAAVVREDARQAVIRATLDAVNRRVERMLTDQ